MIKKKILVVDDEPITLEMIKYHLYELGYEIVLANSGIHALEKIQESKFDLIISDIMMPRLSGFDLLTLLQQNYHIKTPMLFISSSGKFFSVLEVMGFSAANFMLKPLDFDALAERIKLLTEPAKD